MDLVFECDEEKASRNQAKHGIKCEEAKTVFNDPWLPQSHKNGRRDIHK